MNKKQSQLGFAHLIIIIIILSLVLLGALGFVYWQNFIQIKDDASKVDTATQTTPTDDASKVDTATQTTPTDETATVVNNFLASFLSYMTMPKTDSHNEISFASQSPVLTDTYKDSIVNPGGMVYVSPIILAQNLFSSFTVGNATTTSTSSSVPVTLKFGGNSTSNIVYSLVLVENEWKIDGVSRS